MFLFGFYLWLWLQVHIYTLGRSERSQVIKRLSYWPLVFTPAFCIFIKLLIVAQIAVPLFLNLKVTRCTPIVFPNVTGFEEVSAIFLERGFSKILPTKTTHESWNKIDLLEAIAEFIRFLTSLS